MMSNKKILLNIFGLKLSIEGRPNIIEWVRHDYGRYVIAGSDDQGFFCFRLNSDEPKYDALPSVPAEAYHDDYIVYDAGGDRYLDFFGRALAIYKINVSIEITCFDPDRLYDIFYLLFESWLTEALGKRGLHPIHCFAVEKNGQATIVLLPPGGGKTTLALKFLEQKECKVLSEDIAVYFDGRVHGLHFRWGSRCKLSDRERLMKREKHSNKYLIDVSGLELAESARPVNLVVGRRLLSGESQIHPFPRRKLFWILFKNMVLGLELQQSFAIFLVRSLKEDFGIFTLIVKRFFSMIRLFINCKSFVMEMGSGSDSDFNLLNDFIEVGSGPRPSPG